MGRRGNILVSDFPSIQLPKDGLYHYIHGKLLEYGSKPAIVSYCLTTLQFNSWFLMFLKKIDHRVELSFI